MSVFERADVLSILTDWESARTLLSFEARNYDAPLSLKVAGKPIQIGLAAGEESLGRVRLNAT